MQRVCVWADAPHIIPTMFFARARDTDALKRVAFRRHAGVHCVCALGYSEAIDRRRRDSVQDKLSDLSGIDDLSRRHVSRMHWLAGYNTASVATEMHVYMIFPSSIPDDYMRDCQAVVLSKDEDAAYLWVALMLRLWRHTCVWWAVY